MDGQSAIALSKNPVFHERSKHIDVRFLHSWFFMKQEGKAPTDYIYTKENLQSVK
jgi:hypothetical protein